VLLGPGALARLLQHNWPGNVRELASVLETALLEADNSVILPGNPTFNATGNPPANQTT
jgi:transcriptional regulator of acetoin/glycerol metabolism